MAPVPAHRRKESLFANVAIGTLVAIVGFSAFYVLGAIIGLAMIGAVGAILLGGLIWASLKGRRALAPTRARTHRPLP